MSREELLKSMNFDFENRKFLVNGESIVDVESMGNATGICFFSDGGRFKLCIEYTKYFEDKPEELIHKVYSASVTTKKLPRYIVVLDTE